MTNIYAKEEESKGNFLTKAFSYSFGILLKDIVSPLLVDLFLGALITVAIPNNLSEILV